MKEQLLATHHISVLESGMGEIEELLKEIDMFAMSMMVVHPPPVVDTELDFRIKAQTTY
jgi:hypothetical protein